MGDTTISWTDKTWNPVRGCSRVSEGCRNCYAEKIAARFSGPGQAYEGLATIRGPKGVPTSRSRWTGEVAFVPEHLVDPLKWRAPKRVFVNSMSDLFHEKLSNEQIAAVFGVMAAAPRHTFQVLTKRAARMREWFEWMEAQPRGDEWDHRPYRLWEIARDAIRASHPTIEGCVWDKEVIEVAHTMRWPLPNVWIGVSVENQAAADERAFELSRVPAAVRFYSCEPLLERVDLRVSSGWQPDWVIAGAESGHGARDCRVEWLRVLRDQCRDLGIAFFAKQANRTVEICEQCSDEITFYVAGETCSAFCKCTVEGGEVCDAPAVAGGDLSRFKDKGLVELPYIDGVQHAAFPEVRR